MQDPRHPGITLSDFSNVVDPDAELRAGMTAAEWRDYQDKRSLCIILHGVDPMTGATVPTPASTEELQAASETEDSVETELQVIAKELHERVGGPLKRIRRSRKIGHHRRSIDLFLHLCIELKEGKKIDACTRRILLTTYEGRTRVRYMLRFVVAIADPTLPEFSDLQGALDDFHSMVDIVLKL